MSSAIVRHSLKKRMLSAIVRLALIKRETAIANFGNKKGSVKGLVDWTWEGFLVRVLCSWNFILVLTNQVKQYFPYHLILYLVRCILTQYWVPTHFAISLSNQLADSRIIWKQYIQTWRTYSGNENASIATQARKKRTRHRSQRKRHSA